MQLIDLSKISRDHGNATYLFGMTYLASLYLNFVSSHKVHYPVIECLMRV